MRSLNWFCHLVWGLDVRLDHCYPWCHCLWNWRDSERAVSNNHNSSLPGFGHALWWTVVGKSNILVGFSIAVTSVLNSLKCSSLYLSNSVVCSFMFLVRWLLFPLLHLRESFSYCMSHFLQMKISSYKIQCSKVIALWVFTIANCTQLWVFLYHFLILALVSLWSLSVRLPHSQTQLPTVFLTACYTECTRTPCHIVCLLE